MGHSSSPGFQARSEALRNAPLAQQQQVPSDRRQDKKPPILMNRYQLIKVLGRGGFGVTALAKDYQLPGHPYCVIKQLCPKIQDQDTLIRSRYRFKREAKTLAALGGHAQIPLLFNYFEQKGQFFLVQEFIPGQTLTHKVKAGGPWSEPEVIAFLENMLPVLDYVHQHGVIHRDLKPSNIMQCSQDDRFVLLDFGAMKSALASEETSAQITRQFVGTPGFAPPEQQQLRPCFASDLYALGMTCLFLLSGHWPQSFPWDKRRQSVQWTEKISVSKPLEYVLNRLLITDLTQRYRSAEEVLNSLSKIVKRRLPTPAVVP
ncbi:MAG: protein kinase domain-containing protein, partial [Prochlorotrichaceae cyanobacterium]